MCSLSSPKNTRATFTKDMKLFGPLACAAIVGSASAAALDDRLYRLQVSLWPPQQKHGAPVSHSASAPPSSDGRSQVHWRNATSTKGNPYIIGIEKNTDGASVAKSTTIDDREGSWEVHWPVGRGWRQAGMEGLSEYNLLDAKGWVYRYELDLKFKMYSGQGIYHFCDESGDCYKLGVCQGYNHYVNFNSDKPTIRKVRFRKERC